MLAHEKQSARNLADATQVQLPPRWLRIPKAVAYCGIGRSSLYEAMSRGEIRSSRVGGCRLIDRESLDQWVEKHTVPPAVE